MGATFFVGAPGSPATASGGKVSVFNNISTTPLTVVNPRGDRASIIFHNPGSVDILVYPTISVNGSAITPSPSSRGGTFLVFANGGSLTITGECQGAWGVISVSGSGNPVTIMESNVS